MIFRRLFFGCWFSHDPIWEAQHFRCLTCGTVIQVLPQKLNLKGDAHIPAPVRGQPTAKAKKVRVGNVREWKRSER